MNSSLIHNQVRVRYIVGILLLFHIVGLIIMLVDENSAQLSSLNLVLTGFLLFMSESNYFRASLSLILIFVGGFVVEYIGVHTGFLFGDYTYGAALGPKMGEIPLVIGVNWFCIVLASSSLVFSLKANRILKAILAGLLCTGLDFIIEPVAVKLDFWSWADSTIPIWNYVCWFAFASFFSFLYLSFAPAKNRTARSLFLIWIIFFSILNFVL